MKKNRPFRHFKRSALSLFAGLMFSTPVWAAEDITSLINYLQDVLNTTVKTVAEYIYEFNRFLPKTIITNLGESKTQEITQLYARALTFCQIYNSLPRHKDISASSPPIPEEFKPLTASTDRQYKDLNDLCQKITAQIVDKTDPSLSKKKLSNLLATDNEKPKQSGVFSFAQKGGATAGMGNNSLNFENLVSPVLYDPQTRENALNFVSFSGRTYEPFPLDLGTWRQALEQKAAEPDFINYQMALRSYVAAQSVAVSNLYRMIAERTEQPEITQMKLKDDQDKDIKSPAQYQAYLATHRVNNQDWYNTMNSASSNTIARETLFILAEIQRSLYRMEQTNERLLATLSVMQLINLYSSSNPELKILAPAVESLITGKPKAEAGGT